jgi:dienelactone hydrolase
VNILVETIEKARRWLQGKAGVDAERVSLWGVSKGAELALLAASHYEWVDRVVACVPSSFVWAGFGRAAAEGERYSSWTIQGQPLPFIPHDGFEDSVQGKLSLAGVHQRSLEGSSQERVEAARIPIEKTKAKLLLLGASKDQVWPSGRMVRQIEDELRRVDRGDQVKTFVFEGASHFICGGGGEVTRINPIVKPEGDRPSPEASARAAARAWAETERFLALP